MNTRVGQPSAPLKPPLRRHTARPLELTGTRQVAGRALPGSRELWLQPLVQLLGHALIVEHRHVPHPVHDARVRLGYPEV